MTATAKRALDDPPGGPLLWIIVALELLTFTMVFVVLAVFRNRQPELFSTGQDALDPHLGLTLTLVLVSSGALAASGVHAFRRERPTRARRLFFGAAATGIVFVIVKAFDYRAHAAAGHGLGTDDFWDAYILATSFHLAHVLVGIVLLVAVGRRIGRTIQQGEETAVAGSALFWHMCDAVWFFLFPLFYARIAA